MPLEEFNFENLRNQTLHLLNELKDSKNQEILKDKIISLWKNIPHIIIKKENDNFLTKYKYNNSEETTLYMILYHLFTTGNEDVIDTFYAEYKGKHKNFINISINNYREFVSYKNKFKEGNYSLEKFINSCGISNELVFYYNMLRFLENENLSNGIYILRKNIKSISGNFINESKDFLKCLVFPKYKKQKKYEIKIKLEELFVIEFCRLRNFVHGDFLPLVFSQGCDAYKIIQKNNFVFRNFEDNTLPIEIKLFKGIEFHSLFVCPVIKEVCEHDNEPVILECNHVISTIAANILSKYSAGEVFKCPYCSVTSVYKYILKLKLY